ncbi:MAG: hypothetical protein K2L37_06595, partial [Lactobacillus sp.]|nr:hypothetical protein [Lactobacillus sp.]
VIKQPLYLSNNELFMKSKIGVYDFEIVNGKVIGEYVCDRITPCVPIRTRRLWDYGISLEDEISCCLSHEQLREYGKCKTLYLWHITNLKIYDEPKELSEFTRLRPTKFGLEPVKLTRPPQSWVYCEEIS